jgi:aminopeptidase
MMKKERIEAYAKLLVEVGANVQKGQLVVIGASVDSAAFTRLCVRAAYDAGAREVYVNWADDFCTREKYLRADPSIFDHVLPWQKALWDNGCEKDVAWLFVRSCDPELLSGVDADRIQRAEKSSGEAARLFRQRETSDYFSWSIGSVPIPAWSAKVFPDKTPPQAEEALWEAILNAVRVQDGNDPVAEWHAHNATLKRRAEILTGHHLKALKYKNALGTDLTVELARNHIWEGGCSTNANGTFFMPNMPTEEIYTAPAKTGANGVAYAAMPLVLNGTLVEDFSFEFRDGRIVGVAARKGLDVLKNAISVDEGAAYLGEVALVPVDSPIAQSGILYYDTLFDENAACHLAFGEAYPCIPGGAEMTPQQLQEAGLNSSMTHVDFMIGTPDLAVTGITEDGQEIPVMRNGKFVF